MRLRPAVRIALAAAACAYLVVMFETGSRPTSEQFVAFEAAGVMTVTPEHVVRVTLGIGEAQRRFERRAAGWFEHEQPLAPGVAKRLDLAVKFLHTARPVRELAAADVRLDDPAYGLATPTLEATVTLDDGSDILLAFGGHNPDASLQYLRVAPPPRIYLMSNFVGEEWDALLAPTAP